MCSSEFKFFHLYNPLLVSKPISSSVCEEKNFERLFRLHGQVVRNFLYYKSGSLQLAEDWLQEAFLKLWQDCEKVPMEKARSFLFKVAHNLFIDHTRHEKVVFKFLEQSTPATHELNNPQLLFEQQELMQQLQQSIAELPEHQRVVFLLNRFDDLKYTEIAELLNISVKAVEKRMHGALVALRHNLKSTGPAK